MQDIYRQLQSHKQPIVLYDLLSFLYGKYSQFYGTGKEQDTSECMGHMIEQLGMINKIKNGRKIIVEAFYIPKHDTGRKNKIAGTTAKYVIVTIQRIVHEKTTLERSKSYDRVVYNDKYNNHKLRAVVVHEGAVDTGKQNTYYMQ